MFRVDDRRILISRGDTAVLTFVSTGRLLTSDDAVLMTVQNKKFGTIYSDVQTPDAEGKTLFAFMNQETVKWNGGEYNWDIRVVLDAVIEDGEIVGGRDVTTPFPGDKFIVQNTVGDVHLTTEQTAEGVNAATMTLEVNEQAGEVEFDVSTASSGALTVDWVNILNKPSTYPPSAHTHSPSQVGADPSGTAASAVASHNKDTSAHADLRKDIEDLKNSGTSGAGMSQTARDLLVTILRKGVYTEDQSANITALETALGSSGEDTGGGETPDATTYTIDSELINCASSNSAATVAANAAYSATLTAHDGYTLDGGTVMVTMGGVDVTAAAYAGGVITISAVTGNVEIFASAIAAQVEAELPTDGLVGFWDFRNCDYSASSMAATVGDGGLVRFGGTSSDDYGMVANTSLAYNPTGSGAYTAFHAPITFGGMAYAERDAPTLWNGVIVNSNILTQFANLSGITWYDSAGTGYKLGDAAPDAPEYIEKNSLDSGYSYFVTTIDEAGVMKHYYQGNLVAALDPAALGLADFDHWNVTSTYIGNYDRTNPVTALAIYDRAITEVEAASLFEYMRAMEVGA